MSNDSSDPLPGAETPDTNPMVEQIVAELRALREETQATRIAVENMSTRLDRLEADVRTLRGGQP
jgi:hypothetical protein